MHYRKIAEPPPPEEVTGKMWYHGTPSKSAFDKIRSDGIQPHLVTTHRMNYRRTPGMVYLTAELPIAATFAAGMTLYRDSYSNSGQKFGWILSVDGDDLKDVYPDLDAIARSLYSIIVDNETDFLPEGTEKWFVSLVDKHKNDNGPIPIDKHEFVWDKWSFVIAKNMISDMTDKQLLSLLPLDIESGIMNKGTVMPLEGYRLNVDGLPPVEFGNMTDDRIREHFLTQVF